MVAIRFDASRWLPTLALLAAFAVGIGLYGSSSYVCAQDDGKSISNSIGIRLAQIPSGSFDMGSRESERGRGRDEYLHRVRITRPFYISVYEVTAAEFQQFLDATAYKPKSRQFRPLNNQQDGKLPVVNVAWIDAVEFCQWLSGKEGRDMEKREYRLPTETEWEYACRSGTQTSFHFGNEFIKGSGNCLGAEIVGRVYGYAPLRSAVRVGSFNANAHGVYDMHGNVWEWCADWYDKNYYTYSPVEDPKGPELKASSRVIRGGYWAIVAEHCRSANRSRAAPSHGYPYVGFRVVLGSK